MTTAFLVGAAGCVAMQDAPPGTPAEPVRSLTLDWSSSRVGPAKTGDSSAASVHTYADLQARGLSQFASRSKQNLTRGGPIELDWNIPTDAPVTAPAAVYSSAFSSGGNLATDALFFATKTSGAGITAATGPANISNYVAGMATSNFFKLKLLYNAIPTVAWYANVGNVDGSGVAITSGADRVYVLSATQLHCFLFKQPGEPAIATATDVAVARTTANECTGFPVTPGGSFTRSSPWVDDGAKDAIYIADLSGKVYRYNSAGALKWSLTLGAGAAIHSDPVDYNNDIFVGSDSGTFYRITDTLTGSVTPGAPVAFASGAATAVYGSALIDTVGNKMYWASNDKLFQVDLGTNVQTSRALLTGNTGIIYSSPSIDYVNGYLYLAFNNALFKAVYPVTAGSALYSVATAYQSSDTTYPRATPLAYNGDVFLGTSGSGTTGGGGALEEYACNTANTAPALTSLTQPYGGVSGTSAASDPTPVIDFSTGNANFGYTTTGGKGGIVQISMSALTAAKYCPSGMATQASAACGGTTAACVTGATCADRPSNAGSTVCGVFTETYSAGNSTISCPTGTVIVGVKFASYGTATGTCAADNLTVDPTCHSTISDSAFLGSPSSCLNKNSCTFDTSNVTFGTPCGGAQGVKHFSVKAICDTSATKVCSSSHLQAAACSNGTSCTGTCDTGYSDCNGNLATDGCEIATQTDTSHCGSCSGATAVCNPLNISTNACVAGACAGTCVAGTAHCPATGTLQAKGCETTLASSGCGAGNCCGATCTAGSQACIGGACVSSTTICSGAAENAGMTLTCPPGMQMTAFPFSSYGNPNGTQGTCGSYSTGTCTAGNSTSKVSAACLNKTTCTVTADNTTFTPDPCVGTRKWLFTTATCTPITKC